MKNFNCTTPFGIDKSTICEDPIVGKKALNLYNNYNFNYNGKYLDPCNFVECKVILQNQEAFGGLNASQPNNTRQFNLEFDVHSRVKKIKTFQLYSFESLVAEIGGWVGLFLGVSIHLSTNRLLWLCLW